MQENKQIIHVFPDKERSDAWNIKATLPQAKKFIEKGVDADMKIIVEISARSMPRDHRERREG